MDTTLGPGEEFPDIRPFVIGCIVPDYIDQSLVRIALFDLGQKLCCADPINGGGLDKGCIEGFQIDRAMDIHAATACGGRDGRM